MLFKTYALLCKTSNSYSAIKIGKVKVVNVISQQIQSHFHCGKCHRSTWRIAVKPRVLKRPAISEAVMRKQTHGPKNREEEMKYPQKSKGNLRKVLWSLTFPTSFFFPLFTSFPFVYSLLHQFLEQNGKLSGPNCQFSGCKCGSSLINTGLPSVSVSQSLSCGSWF